MINYLLALSKAELTKLSQSERKKFIVALEYGSPASHLEEIRKTISDIEAALALKEQDKKPPPVDFPEN